MEYRQIVHNTIKNKWVMKFGCVCVLLVWSLMASSCASFPWAGIVYSGENEEMLAGTRWAVIWKFPSDSESDYVIFEADGVAKWYDITGKLNNIQSKNSTWRRSNDDISIILTNGYVRFDGKLNNNDGVLTITGFGKNGKGYTCEGNMSKL
jgi:hypothetical protein